MVAASFGDPLRCVIVEMGDEVGPHNVVLYERPPRGHVKGLNSEPTPPKSTIKPVERLSSAMTALDVDAHLVDASVIGRNGNRKAVHADTAQLEALIDPCSSLVFGHCVGHEGVPRDVRVLARLGDFGCVVASEQTQPDSRSRQPIVPETLLSHAFSLTEPALDLGQHSERPMSLDST